MDTLTALVGKKLTSITFILDYMQFGFDDARITAITDPVISVAGSELRLGDTEYRNQLCNQIGSSVVHASVLEGEKIFVEFSSGAQVSISLRPEDYVTVEAVVVQVEGRPTAIW
jgi:hypothetical protein